MTPLISIEGSEIVSDERRGRVQVLNKTLDGLEACRRHGLLIGVATSVCQTNIELVSEAWLRRLIDDGRALRLVPHLSRRRAEAESRSWR